MAAGGVALLAGRHRVAEALVDRAEGRADVFEFLVDVGGEFGKSDHHGEDGDRGDEDQFGRDDETGFVVAEGVELEEQLYFLSQNQCDEVQGFLFSHPLDPSEATRRLQSQTWGPAAS